MKKFGPTQKAIDVPRLTPVNGKLVGVGGDYITPAGGKYPEATQTEYRLLAKQGFKLVKEINDEEE